MLSSWNAIRGRRLQRAHSAFAHAHTQGDDVKDALRNAREAIELEIEVMTERGEVLPRSDADADSHMQHVSVTQPDAYRSS